MTSYRHEIDLSDLGSLDFSLKAEITEVPFMAVHETFLTIHTLLGANIPNLTRAQNSYFLERYKSEGMVVTGTLRINCASKVIQLSERLTEDTPERIVASKASADPELGRHRIGSQVVRIWECDETGPKQVVTAKRISIGVPPNTKIPKGEPLDDFLLDAGPVLEGITGTGLGETTDFCFIAKLTQDYLRTELQYANLNYPEYFVARKSQGQ